MSAFNLAELFLDTDLSDITFVVEDEDIPGHRVVFASAYPHFKNMLVGEEESQEKRFHLKNTSAKALKEVKRFIYLGHLDIESWNVEDLLDLLTLAKESQLEDVFSKVIEALKMQPLDFDSWHSVKSAASIYGSIALEAKCVSFAEEKWTDFLQLKHLDKFTAEFLCCMFGCPKVFKYSSTCNQDELRSAISTWKMDRSDEELRSVLFNFKKESKNAYVMMMKEFFPFEVNTDSESQMWTVTTPNLENPSESNVTVKRVRLSNEEEVMEPLECFARVDSVVLAKDRKMEFELPDNKGRLVVGLHRGCIVIVPKKPGGVSEFSVNRVEFEVDTEFSLQFIEGCSSNISGRERPTTYMCSSGPTSKNGCFKYRGVFAYPTPVQFVLCESQAFGNMSEIRLRNLVIY